MPVSNSGEPAARGPTTSATAAASPSPSEPGRFVAERDGYTLTVTLDRRSLAPGETVTFTTTFHNGTDEPIDYAGPPCGAGVGGFMSVRLPLAPTGKSWSGIRQTFKDYVLESGYGPGAVPALDPVQVEFPTWECGEWTISTELAPGDSVTRSMSWKAQIVGGVNALPGDVPFTVSVSYDQQNGPPSYPPDYTGVRGSWSPLFKQLAVTGSVDIVGAGRALKGVGEIIDAVLADRKYAAWLAERPSSTWSNANLYLTSMKRAQGIVPKGPSWAIELFREPRNWAIAFVDPFDASLISVTYCDPPCDR
jgi:hypothetical protein